MTKKTKKSESLTIQGLDSLFDEQFVVADLQSALSESSKQSDTIFAAIQESIEHASTESTDEPTHKYVVNMSEDISDSIDRGDIKLVTNSNGDIFAQIRGNKGQFGERLPIKKELNEHGISADMVQMAMQMEAIKSQLEKIVESLRTIEESVADVIQGQFNDRVGLYFSGLSTYLEARTIKDKGLRQQLIAQALKTLNDANAQMIQEIRTDIEYLISKRYNRSKDKLNKINERLTTIYKCYEVVYRASFLKTMIYQQEGEFASMLATLDEYGRFIEKLIIPNAGKLSELDKNVRMIDTGTWGKIAKTFIGCKDLKRQLSDANTFYLTKSKENNDD